MVLTKTRFVISCGLLATLLAAAVLHLLASSLTNNNSNINLTKMSSSRHQAPAFPNIKSTHSLVAKHVTEDKWNKLADIKTKTSEFTLAKVKQMLSYSYVLRTTSGQRPSAYLDSGIQNVQMYYVECVLFTTIP